MRPALHRVLRAAALAALVPLNACRRAPDLSGEWTGTYPCCGEETIRIAQAGDTAIATKVTGDQYMPAGEETWRANVRTGVGQGRVAGVGFVNPSSVPGRLEILDRQRIRFAWGDAPTGVEFTRRGR